MANTKSAKKMTRKIMRQTLVNRNRRSIIRGLIRKVEEAVAEGDAPLAQSAFRQAQPQIMRAAAKKIYHKNTAARTIARLAKQISTIAS